MVSSGSPREISYLKAHEWVQEADDILWRRSKLGLHLSKDEQASLRAFMAPAAPKAKRSKSG